MIYVRLKDRLGNQMFQYAAARALAQRRATTVQVDLSAYRRPAKWSDYQLWHFPSLGLRSTFPQLAAQFGNSVRGYVGKTVSKHLMTGLGFDPAVNQLSDWTILEGWFTSERYFSDCTDLIRALFDISDFLCCDDINRLHSRFADRTAVSVHVRRGDYVGAKLFDIGNLDRYYHTCFTKVLSDVPDAYFVVVADDPNWCMRWNVLREFDVDVIRDNRPRSPFRDMALMAWCRHHIIGNSTFAWWGAWLGSNPLKRVYMPKMWLDAWTSEECGLSVPGWTEIAP